MRVDLSSSDAVEWTDRVDDIAVGGVKTLVVENKKLGRANDSQHAMEIPFE